MASTQWSQVIQILKSFAANAPQLLLEVGKKRSFRAAIKEVKVAESIGMTRRGVVEIGKFLLLIVLASGVMRALVEIPTSGGKAPKFLREAAIPVLQAVHCWMLAKEKEGKGFPGSWIFHKEWLLLWILLDIYDMTSKLKSILRLTVWRTLPLWSYMLVRIINLLALGIMGYGLLMEKPEPVPEETPEAKEEEAPKAKGKGRRITKPEAKHTAKKSRLGTPRR
jgi:hypothetical protein